MSLGRRIVAAALISGFARRAWAQKPVAVPPSWYIVQVEDNAFTVEMPGIPDHRIVDDKSPRGTPFALHSYSLEAGGNSYVVQTALYPDDVDTTQPRVVLQAALDARAQRLAGGKWSKVDWREMFGAGACESTGPLSAGNSLRQLVLLKQHRFVSLAIMGAAGTVKSVEAERFFKSLNLS
jgi:hypothetical protein